MASDARTASTEAPSTIITTDILIVGTGPAGASLACFLASYGLGGLMVGASSSTADTPRAHITNPAALECLRDIGLDVECERLASSNATLMHTRWAYSMAGEEFARIYSWGNNPERKGEYENASPCRHIDLPQTLLEPILSRYATQHGFKCRMDTKFIAFEEDPSNNSVISTLQDNITGSCYRIRSKYVFGADGARSIIMKQLDLPLDAKPGGGIALDVLVRADLYHLVQYRTGNLHWLLQPDIEHPDYGWLGVARMVKPWDEWIFSLFPSPTSISTVRPTDEQYLKRIKEFIGDDTPVEILKMSKWNINEIVAKEYSKGNIYCLGDAVHRHPPMNGLGSNTCIQDSFNLAWKVAHVLKGQALPSLLSTYTHERQPVGMGIISRANDSFRNHRKIWDSLGVMQATVAERSATMTELASPTPEGRKRRAAFRAAIEHSAHEFHALGIEMGQLYQSTAIYTLDEPAPFKYSGVEADNPTIHYVADTYPGRRLPHVWLNKASPLKAISTIDITGRGTWTVITGIGGGGWKDAAAKLRKELGLEVGAVSIGFRQDWEDVYFDWERVRGVEEDGCVLVRPDRFVAWRAVSCGDEEDRLRKVLLIVLGLS